MVQRKEIISATDFIEEILSVNQVSFFTLFFSFLKKGKGRFVENLGKFSISRRFMMVKKLKIWKTWMGIQNGPQNLSHPQS